MKKLRVVIIVQARMGATRFPGKPLKEVMGKSLLEYLVERLRRVTKADEVVIATTLQSKDQAIVDVCDRLGVLIYRGSEEDVLARYAGAAKLYEADVVVRVTADCPLIDPQVIDQVIGEYLDHYPKYDYVSNTLTRSYPRGMDVEVFSRKSLERADAEAEDKPEREHVTLHLYRHPEIFQLHNVQRDKDDSKHRWTVDTPEDFELVSHLICALYPQNPRFTLNDLLKQMDLHPEWFSINAHIQQKSV